MLPTGLLILCTFFVAACAVVIRVVFWTSPEPASFEDLVAVVRESNDRDLGLDFKRELLLRKQDMTELLHWFQTFRS
jgi:hypothetical protein